MDQRIGQIGIVYRAPRRSVVWRGRQAAAPASRLIADRRGHDERARSFIIRVGGDRGSIAGARRSDRCKISQCHIHALGLLAN